MTLVLEMILSTRVFALYQRSFKVGMFLSILLAGKTAGMIYFLRNRVFAQRLKFTSNCIPEIALTERSIESPIVIFTITEAVHLVIHGLAWKRTFWDLRRYTLARPPLLSVLNRDGLKVFTAISSIPLSAY
ncbi:hypothetical protein BT96DRAFT_911946 [Gymnopus androsaceus JB14]|uniref:Uncharacterized protein n=1 Tax=Gymnopus androsaceus JB14 TaxID=1447944 RepID=A0A6A4INK6_9AGAR|nr:hypothetical protein BT96DRAFT_911946 [Gymnopus androsaceus JB14]